MSGDFQVFGGNASAPFTLKIHRGEGMALLAMNWRAGKKPPNDFVGFAIDYREPGGDRFFTLNNRIGFAGAAGAVNPESQPTTLSPIQKFRWVHFPRNAELAGEFVYRVTPVFMNDADELSYGESQQAALELRRETYPGELNVAFTRGFVSSQAFVDRYESAGPISTLLPGKADDGLKFVPTHPKAEEALAWMGFEARDAILELLDQAIADKQAQVRVVAYDLSEPDVVSRLEKLKARVKVIIDDDGTHGAPGSAETQAEQRLAASAGGTNVKRQHMGKLQHNKTIVVDGPKTQAVVCGSTNYSWRGFFVQANNAVVLRGSNAVGRFQAAFDAYWENDGVAGFSATPAAKPTSVGLADVNARVGFSPYSPDNAQLTKIADDIGKTKSSLLYSLAFLYQTEGPIREAIKAVTKDPEIFVYGISDRKVGGLDVQIPGGNVAAVMPAALGKNAPEPFKSEPTGGGGIRMHHKFVVIDFDKPTARVYFGSYNFSGSADGSNGENLLLVRDRRVAVSYAVEALRIFDHYHFRVVQQESTSPRKQLVLAKPPRGAGEKPWWAEDYTTAHKVRDRELFA
jgi:phosphatidylserine/phosphatidylglycerophosphate/cardiolipin synthase-like enzyme